jgi:hypothetical protein
MERLHVPSGTRISSDCFFNLGQSLALPLPEANTFMLE